MSLLGLFEANAFVTKLSNTQEADLMIFGYSAVFNTVWDSNRLSFFPLEFALELDPLVIPPPISVFVSVVLPNSSNFHSNKLFNDLGKTDLTLGLDPGKNAS